MHCRSAKTHKSPRRNATFAAAVAAAFVSGDSAAVAESSSVPLHNHPTRLISLETANMNPAGTVELSVGTMQTDPSKGSGTGNQLYFGGGSYSPTDRLTFGFDLQSYQDPTISPINGAFPDIKMHTGALWAKYQVFKGSRVSMAALASVENLFALEGPLYGGRNEHVLIGAIKAPITIKASQQLEFHITPGVSFFPSTVGGQPYYGTVGSIGLGASYKPSERLAFFATADTAVSGANNVDSTAAYTKDTVLMIGGRYNVTPKIALEAFVTNGAGLTPATSVLTHWPDGDDVLAGLRLVYTPGANLPISYRGEPAAVTRRQTNLQHDGFTLGSADVLEPGMIRTTVWGGSDSNSGFGLSFSPDQDAEIQLFVEKYSDSPTAPAALVPTTEVRYMIGPKLRFMDQNNGDAFSLSGRMLFGRHKEPLVGGVGVFYLEALASYKSSDRLVFTAAPKLGAFGNVEMAGLGLGVNYQVSDNLELIAEATPVGLDGDTATWAAGLRYNIGKSGFSIDASATNAVGRQGIGSMIAQDDTRFTIALSKTFDGRGLKFW